MRYVILLLISLNHTAWADCRTDTSFGNATHFLVNGLINKGIPEVVFDIPYEQVGNGQAIVLSSVINKGGNKTLDDHIRYRLKVKNSSSSRVEFLSDTSTGLTCTNCSSAVTVPFSSFFWTEGNAIETKGSSPSPNRFTDNEQLWFTSNVNQDSIFNLKYYFDNDSILPPGNYEGEFKTIGRPQ